MRLNDLISKKKVIFSIIAVFVFASGFFVAREVGAVATGDFGLNRNSSNIVLSPGTLNLADGNYTADWDVKQGFQVSLLKEKAGNDVWNFNHYNPGGADDWANYNFADYPYYFLKIDSTGNIPASFYTGGQTGESLSWALYYQEPEGTQTVLGGTLENIAIDENDTLTAFFRISPTNTYRTFDGTGEGFVNTVEIFGGLGMLTDLKGFNINQAGSVDENGLWTSTGDITLSKVIEVPTEVWVDDDYTAEENGGNTWGLTAFDKIQDAIDIVAPGGTINVAAGIYNEPINITKSLTLNGAKADEDARTRDTSSGESILDGTGFTTAQYSLIMIANGVSDVVIDGFEFKNILLTSTSGGVGNAISSYSNSSSTAGANNITIKNNYMHDLGYNGILVVSENTTGTSMIVQTGWTIQYNKIAGYRYAGIELTNVANSKVKDNEIAAPTSLF
ncbi:MAG: hypothetical protein WC619_03390, partial [Patescibacteria group bacterium]